MLPNMNTEDQPPMLRFAQETRPDTIATELTGKPSYMNVIVVYASARGDNKTEITDFAEMVEYESIEIEVPEERKFSDYEKDANGEFKEITRTEIVKVKKPRYTKKITNPWVNKIAERLKNGHISKAYHDFCLARFNDFKKNVTYLPDGVPLKDWTGVNNEALKKKAIELGIVTVELAAEMNEQAMEALGMGARDLKTRAKAFLDADRDSERTANKLVRLESESAAMAEKNSALENKIASLEAMLAAQAEKKPKGKQAEAA